MTTSPSDGKHGVIPARHSSDRGPGGHDLTQHFMTDHEFTRTVGRARPSARDFFAIGTADPHTHHPHLDPVRPRDGGFGPIHHA